jgi:hypothetical protein
MSAVEAPIWFHLSLNVSSLDQAVPYFEKLLRTPVTKRRSDYAKFEIDSPPLVLSLEPRSPGDHGSLNHLGFRFADSAALGDAERQLESLGITTRREEGVECCYARQTKFWVHDGDERLWEFYVLENDLDHRGAGQTLEQMIGTEAATPAAGPRRPVVWEHRMGSPFTLPENRCDEIHLRGTFNVPMPSEAVGTIVKHAFAALVPGGKLMLHHLTAEETLCEPPVLPGPAAYVRHVPVRSELMEVLEAAGFVDVELTTFRSGACFEFKGHPLRETRIEARRPPLVADERCTVLFKGPFKEILDDEGHRWRRGQPQSVPRSRWRAIERSSVAELFVELPGTAAVAQCAAPAGVS